MNPEHFERLSNLVGAVHAKNIRDGSKPPELVFEGEYAPMEMVRRAVERARPRDFGKSPRWVAVRDALGYGSTTSTLLCRRFGLDPHEELEGPKQEPLE